MTINEGREPEGAYSTQTELLTKQIIVGVKRLPQAQIYLHQGIGDPFSKRENIRLSRRRL